MSVNVTVHAIKIKILPAVSGLVEHAELGVYVGATQEIRWSEYPLVGVADTWKSGIIAQNGIGEIEKEIDTREGGAVEVFDGIELFVLNANNLILRFKELGIDINGLVAELHEFIGTDADSDSVETSVRFTGTCAYEAGSSWNESVWRIQLKNNRLQRNAFLGTIINNDATSGNYTSATNDANGKIVPITFGKFEMINSNEPNPAKFLRTAGKETAMSNQLTATQYCSPVGQTVFPINYVETAHNPAYEYHVLLGTSFTGAALTYEETCALFVGKWVKVVEGGSTDGTSLVGSFARISDVVAGIAGTTFGFYIDSVFRKNLAGQNDCLATNQAWISIVDLPFEFAGDTWPCAGFLDDSVPGTVITDDTPPNLFVYKPNNTNLTRKKYALDAEDKLAINSEFVPIGFRRIAPYGYIPVIGAGNNSLEIIATLFDGDPSQLSSSDIFALENFSKYVASSLANWGFVSFGTLNAADNLYSSDSDPQPVIDSHVESNVGGSNPLFDRDDGSYLRHYFHCHRPDGFLTHNTWIAFTAEIPIDKILVEYDSYFLGINLYSCSGDGSGGFENAATRIHIRRFAGVIKDIMGATVGDKYCDDYPDGGAIDDLPDYYYTTDRNVPDKNAAFIFEKTLASQERRISGHRLYFELVGFDSIAKLKSILDIGLFTSVQSTAGKANVYKELHLNELALICKMSAPISTELYPLFAGRIFNSTWGTRKTSTDLINNPVDMLEHFKRLQCGAEFGDTTEPGKEYSTSMPIKTGSDLTNDNGSYDSTILTTVKAYRPVYQIHDANEAWTDEQIKNICRTFNLCTFTNKSGYECVTTLSTTSPSETISFTNGDIIKGSIGETVEANVQDVFCQPIFNYQFNYGSDKFDKQLLVLNVQETAFNAAYTPGISNALHTLDATLHDSEYIWTKCRNNFLKYRQIEQCPSSFSNQKMIVLYADAVKLLNMKIDWMGKTRQTLAVNYTKGKDYFAGKHVKIKLPHQTCNLAVECVIEHVKISKNRDRVDLRVVLLESVPTAFFFDIVQNEFMFLNSLEKWQDAFEKNGYAVIQDKFEM